MRLLLLTLLMAALAGTAYAQPDRVRTRGQNNPNPRNTQPNNTTQPNANPTGQREMGTFGGQVKGPDNEPVVGATVVITNRNTSAVIGGAYTDENGKFAITVQTGDPMRLVVTYVGMKTYEQDLDRPTENLAIAMQEDILQLDEVVVTALAQEQRRAAATYALSEIEGQRIVQSGEVNVVTALAGKAAGIQTVQSSGVPGASSSILVRGASTIEFSNQPLFVIDGVPMDNQTIATDDPDVNYNSLLAGVAYSNRAIDVNPEDIENVTILRGPAAAALYGARAGKGAIVITTKRGRNLRGAPRVQYSSTVEVSTINRYHPTQNRYVQGSGTPEYDTDGNPIGGRWVYNPNSSASWGPALGDTSLAGRSIGNHDQQREFFQTATSYRNNLSIVGGSDAATYRLSIGQLEQKGIVPNTSFSRYSFRLTGNADLSPRISVFGTANYIRSGGNRVQQGSNLSGVALGLLRAPISFDLSNYENPDGSMRTYFGLYDNPYWSVNKNRFGDKVDRLIGSASLQWRATDFLELTYRIGTDVYNDRRNMRMAIGSNDASGVGKIVDDNNRYAEIYGDLLLTARRQWTDKIFTRLTLGNNLNHRQRNRTYTRGTNLVIPDFFNMSNASVYYGYNHEQVIRSLAYFYNAHFNYDDMVYVDLTGRYEFVSTFSPENNGFFYPSVNTGFVFTRLPFLRENRVLPFGKIRASWSRVGQEPPAYATRNYYSSPLLVDGYTNGNSFPYGGNQAFGRADLVGNPNIRPEVVTAFEVGADLRFFRDYFHIDFTYYNQKTTDIILRLPIAPSTGNQIRLANIGSMVNRGFEIEAGSTPIRKRNFQWDISLVWTRNRNEVTALANGMKEVAAEVGFFDPQAMAVVGQPYGVLYGFDWYRDNQGRVITDPYGYPIIDPTQKPLANPYPEWLGGITNSFTIMRNIRFSFLWDIRWKGYVWNGTQHRMNFHGTSQASQDREGTIVYEGVAQATDEQGNPLTNPDGSPVASGQANTVPMTRYEYWRFVNNAVFGVTNDGIQDATWYRLREVSLGYTFRINNPRVRRVLQGVELGVTARNLILITPHYKGIDPETSLTGAGSNIVGLEYFNLPNTRSWIFNLRFLFN
jgi:TonB-linked SusC/RagA family outer membrane protein